LVGTAEITLGGMLADTILEEEQLPLLLAGLSHCFRTEAGSAGQESRGLYRVHQFTKVELFAFTSAEPGVSDEMHRADAGDRGGDLQGLGIPYRVIDIASGDLGGPAYRKFDLEAWMPGRGAYGEITSTSNCTDYQARRLKIRYRPAAADGSKQKPVCVHMLNGTAVACSRALVAIFENYQQADGSVVVPERAAAAGRDGPRRAALRYKDGPSGPIDKEPMLIFAHRGRATPASRTPCRRSRTRSSAGPTGWSSTCS
jgi:seryl-tRNA synthetase